LGARGARGYAGYDVFGHVVEEGEGACYDAAGLVDVLDAGADELGVRLDRADELGAFL
jgi:hypothetical protein